MTVKLAELATVKIRKSHEWTRFNKHLKNKVPKENIKIEKNK